MPFYRLRMLRNQEGASPGGGAPPVPPAQPATPPTPPQAQGGVIPNAELVSVLKEFRDGIFADLRKAGAFGKQGKDPETPVPKPPEGSTPSTGLSRDDVSKMLARRDALHGAMSGVTMPDGARRRMLSAFEAENPDDPTAWVNTYVADFGFQRSGSAAAAGAGTQPPPAGAAPGTVQPPPISDKGPPQGHREFEQITNPSELTASDIERLQAKHGEDKANDMIRDMARRYLRDKRFVPGK